MTIRLPRRDRPERPDRAAVAEAVRLLWSDQVLDISDEEFAKLGRVLGLEEASRDVS